MKAVNFELTVIFGGVSTEHDPSIDMAAHFCAEVQETGHGFKGLSLYYLNQ